MKISRKSKVTVATLIFILLILIGIIFIIGKRSVTVAIQDNPPWFFPAILEIKPGTEVTWKLQSPAVHPVMTLEEPPDISEIHSGHFTRSWSYIFHTPGIYVYICPIHPYMKGVIGVGQEVPPEKIPVWVNWPPPDKNPPATVPTEPGYGRIWLGAQFHQPPGKNKPGTIIIINAETWRVDKVIDDQRLNNPHNLWEVDGKVIATNWFDLFVSVIDGASGTLEKHIWLGESPAHVQAHSPDKIYVTLQGDDGLAILNRQFDLVTKKRVPKGPHGHWISTNGKLMSLASTEKGKISVWDTETDKIVFEEFLNGQEIGKESTLHTHALPLFAGITGDGRYAFTAASSTGKFYVFDVEKKRLVKSFEIGSVPIQTVPTPDDQYVLVPLTGSGEVAVIDSKRWELVKKISHVGAGAHGVYYGKKQTGGWYAYISNKFSTWVTVIDLTTLEVAGYIPLPKDAWGGQGILVTD